MCQDSNHFDLLILKAPTFSRLEHAGLAYLQDWSTPLHGAALASKVEVVDWILSVAGEVLFPMQNEVCIAMRAPRHFRCHFLSVVS